MQKDSQHFYRRVCNANIYFFSIIIKKGAIFPSLNRHLNMVEGFECSNDPSGYVVWGLNAPGRVSHGKQAIGDRSDKERFKNYKIEARDIAWYGGAGDPPWNQAWGRDSSESAWWLGCSSRDLARPSPNERRETIPQWAHHLQGEP
ncbi:hypothetical protein XENOCAPTIV_017848 [Xenoophorus captivus]|uniref:Uncharacterized protein n=1 Tax=Xenoophorus captivus TaxID=1517983 RepID=A0ABV0QT83_9TELE